MMTEQPQEDTNVIYETVENFVKQFHEKDVALKPEAKTLIIERTMGKDFLGRAIKKEYSLADIIGEQIVEYIRIQNAMDETVAFYSKKENKPDSMFSNSFTTAMDIMRGLSKRRNDVVIALFENIERAQINNLIDEIGLGKKIKAFEEENEELKKKNANLQKVNDILAKENTKLHRLLPDAMKDKSEVGDLGKLDS
jgi:hypothetical protein